MAPLNDDVWFKYAEGIKNWSGKNSGQEDRNTMYFIASAVNKGPAAGSFVPDANMNSTLSQLCDALISTTSPEYNPGAQGSYFDNVFRYIGAVKLKQNMEEGLLQQLKDSQTKAAEATKAYNATLKQAVADWTDDPVSGKAAAIAFQDWATQNAPNVFMAQQTRDGSAQAVMQINSQIFGPGAAQLTHQQNALLAASNKLTPATGLNMKVCPDQIPPADYRKYYQALMNKTVDSLPPMTEGASFLAPLYSIDPTFKTTMDEWAQVPLEAADEFSWSIKSEEVQKSSWTKLGHIDGGGGISFGWLRIKAPVRVRKFRSQ